MIKKYQVVGGMTFAPKAMALILTTNNCLHCIRKCIDNNLTFTMKFEIGIDILFIY
jgi:hypothetical protein